MKRSLIKYEVFCNFHFDGVNFVSLGEYKTLKEIKESDIIWEYEINDHSVEIRKFYNNSHNYEIIYKTKKRKYK